MNINEIKIDQVNMNNLEVFVCLLGLCIFLGLLLTMLELNVDVPIPRFNLRMVGLICVVVLYFFVGFYRYQQLPDELTSWYAQKVTPYLKQLPLQRFDEVTITPQKRYKNGVLYAKIDIPDSYGFSKEAAYYGTLHEDKQTKTAYMTYKKVEQDLGGELKKGEYDVQFYVPTALYEQIMTSPVVPVVQKDYQVIEKTPQRTLVPFWISVILFFTMLILIVTLVETQPFRNSRKQLPLASTSTNSITVSKEERAYKRKIR